MDEIVSILENPEKIKQLILKLKTLGDDSLQFQTFKQSIDSFHLNKPPRGVHEKNILQHAFKYSDSRECFDNFRLVCKSWKNSVETIRLDRWVPVEFIGELCRHTKNNGFPQFYSKYIKIFKHFRFYWDEDLEYMEKWEPISNLLFRNLKNLGNICIDVELKPPNFTQFLFKLFENSQSTLEMFYICWATEDVLTLPTIDLPNLRCFELYLPSRGKMDINTFDYLIKHVASLCKYLKIFELFLQSKPALLDYIIKNYPNHFVCGPLIQTLDHIPLKFSYLNLEDLAAYRYAPHIEYLVLITENFSVPNEGGWSHYKEILSFFPNLKGITFHGSDYDLDSALEHLSLTNQNIWKERILYFKSKNIKILCKRKYSKILSEFRQLYPSWTFEF